MVAYYFEFYEEGEVEDINGPTHPPIPATRGLLRSVTTQLGIYRDLFMHPHAVSGVHYMYINQQSYRIGPNIIDMLDFTFFI